MKRSFLIPALVWLGAVLPAPTFVHAAEPVAQVIETKGAVSLIKTDQRRLLVAPQSTLMEGDTVVTESNSSAVLAFTDGSKVALRPNSRFGIAHYRFVAAEPAKDIGVFNLLAGGFRTVTGAIGKRSKTDAYRVQSVTATIGIRGTDYTARLCSSDCPGTSNSAAVPSIRIVDLKGSVTTTPDKGTPRRLTIGDEVRNGDLVEAGADSWAGIAFNDESRLVLRSGSAMRIADYRFVAQQPEADVFAVNLVRGAFRAVTGLIGKRDSTKVSFGAVTATIGVRGTGFDVWCTVGGGVAGPCGQGLLTTVREGRVVVGNAQGEVELGRDQFAFVASPAMMPGLIATPDTLPPDDGTPLPDSLPLVGNVSAAAGKEGELFVQVNEGRIVLSQDGVNLEFGAGQSGMVNLGGGPPQRLEAAPVFLTRDPFTRTVDFDAVSCSLP